MSNAGIVTIELDTSIDGELERLAREGHRSKEAVIKDAIADYIARERRIAAEIESDLAELRAGRTDRFVPHQEAIRRLEALLPPEHDD